MPEGSLCLKAILNSKATNKEHKNMWHQIDFKKGTYLHMRAEIRRKPVALFYLAENVLIG